VQEAISVDAWNRMEDVNAVIFHQLEDNLRQELGARVAIGSWTKRDPSYRGHSLLEHRSPAVLS
jgi:hypothetical protein